MVKNPVDAYLAAQPEPQRTTLQALRETIHSLLPAAAECLSYSVPAFACDGTAIAGFSGSKSHCSYLPFSGSLLESMATEVAAYRTSKGALLFPIDRPPPRTLIRKLIVARLDAESRARPKSGKVREFYENGVLKAAGKMRDGELHGDWTWYRKDGTRMRTGSFDLGTQVGVWRTWGRTEALVKETHF